MTRVGLVGRGRAASALAVALEDTAGVTLAWHWSRGEAGVDTLPACDVVLLAVPDGAIEDAARALAVRASARGEIWLHLSGSRDGRVARADATTPRAAGCLHPLVALAGADSRPLLRGAVAGVDGEPAAVVAADALGAAIGLRTTRLAPGGKALYHAAAVTVAGHAVALWDQGVTSMVRAGVPVDDARAALLALMRGAVAQLEGNEPADAITGPIARGDVDTVRAHLRALETAEDRDAAVVYRALARRALAISRARLAPDVAEAIAAALG
ncbi:MAG: DUF2520 domain-containing protein [Deltaproteobacteria bacterium]|nr:DUF2520 domain-containing protein [Deltaproteobacteria bacterium]